MEKHELVSLINEGLSTRQIGARVGKSQSSVKYWLKKLGLNTKKKRYNAGGSPPICKTCGESNPSKFYKGQRTFCKACDTERVRQLQRRNKQQAVDEKGGKCERCGYDRCIAALDFHHPGEKDSRFSNMMLWRWERIEKEINRCMLLCSNCHREEHYQGE